MKTFALLCVICLQFIWSHSATTKGVAAVAYQDSSGNRYEGAYGLSDGQVESFYVYPWAPPRYNPYYNDFAPDYFRNLENLLQESSTSNIAGFSGIPEIPGFPDFPTIDMTNFSASGVNSAFSSAVLTPGMSQQVAAISPGNPSQPNVDEVTYYTGTSNPGSNVMSVSSTSYASSSSKDGKEVTSRGAQTVVNNNGQVTSYKVQS